MKHLKHLLAAALTMLMALAIATPAFAGSIKIETDKTYEGTDQEYVYDAYKIFDATYDKAISGTWTQGNKDANADIAYTPGDAAVAYFMKTGNPWIATIQGLTTYFKVTAVTGGYVVEPTDAYNSTAAAKAVAASLKTALASLTLTGEYEATEITADGNAVTVADGYYLIVGRTAANLALVTTDVTIVEKNEYPSILKEFSDETTVSDLDAADDEATSNNDTVQVGDTVSYTLTVPVPSGANQQIVITDTFSSGLDPVLDNGVVKVTPGSNFTGTATASAPANGKFTITISAADVIANQGKTITFVYEAVVTEDAWYEVEPNTGDLKYGNDFNAEPSRVDSETFWVEIDKKANAEDGDDLKGAKFEVYRTDNAGHAYTRVPVKLIALSDADLQAGGITKAADTVYYRAAGANETGVTEIDMTNAPKAKVYGLDGDSTYIFHETQAPKGFNLLTADVQVVMQKTNHVQPVVNNSGTVLPSTGGIGTTIFYVVGGALVITAGVLLVTKRRMASLEK